MYFIVSKSMFSLYNPSIHVHPQTWVLLVHHTYRTVGTCEAQTEACMALPGPAKGLAVATVTYINYPSRRKP